jgi:glycosyltransferase involved in cell wall biosynthesis
MGIDTIVVTDEEAIRISPPKDIEAVFVRHVGRGRVRVPVRLPISKQDRSVLITHAGWTLTNIVAGMHARRHDVPYIVMAHAVYDPHVVHRRALLKAAWLAGLERSYLEKAMAVHVFFPEEAEHLSSLRVQTPVVIAPNGVDPPQGIRWDGGSGGYVLWLGRYDPIHKGLDILLHGLSLLPSSNRPHVRFHGRDYKGGRGVVERLSRELGLEDTVHIGGPIYGEKKWEAMAQAIGFVHPSRWEGSSIAVGEAISIGAPTLVAGYAMGRFLAARECAILVDNTAIGVRDGIERLLSDDAKKLGARGREVAHRELSWDVLARSWVAQAERLLADTNAWS